ncbi:phosphate ABC transporter substrate-binding protein PstS [Thiorhodovibrio frisius]|uniref:Phosphate-binding protein PstS n=1 Tax=Thiorhodovibrio frisius TaxID=631362 RepID=H8Z867_9GAMM|nr:phosphate ABC transporter substrate-binding protein PstS [Thiorhodovibrio frisius]EIC21016.1 phosphate ABC transporter, phosphate-binding protein [Thiorhodovibrio frisius]WPL22072.1 Phosphate-binding protein PstS precursor [Thiorhodovibrio frisius]
MALANFTRRTLAACTLSALAFAPLAHAEETQLTGSGASFPFPLYAKWAKDFSKKNKDIQVQYQAVGSGAGIRAFIAETVDFAASDAAMNDEEIAKVPAEKGVVLLPMTAGEVVLSYNLPGNPELKLPRDVMNDIFLGKLTTWQDERLQKANPGVKFPDDDITVVRRSDSSGTTYVFTGHLACASDEFKKDVGHGKSVDWPKSFVGAPKNDGVAAMIKQTPGAIGYIEYGYAEATGQPMATLQNKAGEFVKPGEASGQAALASAEFPSGDLPGYEGTPDLRVWVCDPEGKEAYPIATFTWMLMYQHQDEEKAKVLRDFVEYGLNEGQKSAPKMGYIPLPANVKAKVEEALKLVGGAK